MRKRYEKISVKNIRMSFWKHEYHLVLLGMQTDISIIKETLYGAI